MFTMNTILDDGTTVMIETNRTGIFVNETGDEVTMKAFVPVSHVGATAIAIDLGVAVFRIDGADDLKFLATEDQFFDLLRALFWA